MSGVIKLIFYCIAQLLLGATMMVMIMYFIEKGASSLHVVLGTLGFNFLSVQAILWLNYWNGWSSPQFYRCVHICLQVVGLSCAFAGGIIALIDHGLSGMSGAHEICGVVALILAGITAIMGLVALVTDWEITLLHVSLGLLTLISYTICFILGLVLSPFKGWAHPTVWIIMILFICIYTVIILFTTCIKSIRSY